MNSHNVILGTLFVCLCWTIIAASPRPRPDEEHYFDKEVNTCWNTSKQLTCQSDLHPTVRLSFSLGLAQFQLGLNGVPSSKARRLT